MPTRKTKSNPSEPRKAVSEPVLSGDVIEAMLAAALPAEDAEARATQARVRSVLMQRVADAAQAATRTVRASEAAWQPCMRGVERLIVDGAGPMHTWLLRIAPGSGLPAHEHDHGDEESFILSGSCVLNGECLRAGDYHHAGKGSRHDRLLSAEGCVLWLRMPAAQALALVPRAAL